VTLKSTALPLRYPIGVACLGDEGDSTNPSIFSDSVSRDCGEDQFIENKDKVKILNKV
jgi:hypothetical protein